MSASSLYDVFIGGSAAVLAAVLRVYLDVAAVAQPSQVAADRVPRYAQRGADSSLWDCNFAVLVR